MNNRNLKRIIRFALAVLFITAGFLFVQADPVCAAKAPGKVKGLKIKAVDYKTVSISFKTVKGAGKYQVYRASSKTGKYKKIKTTKETTLEISGIKTGKTYYYKVRAVKGKKHGKFSKAVSKKTKLKKTKIRISKTAEYVDVSWESVPGAKGYYVYRKAEGGAKQVIKKIKGGSKTDFRDTGLKNLVKYWYGISAYRGETTAEMSKTVSTTFYAQPEDPVIAAPSAATKGIKVSWEPSDNAYNYEIYRKEHEGSTFNKILSVSSSETSAVDKSAKIDQSYDYYVRAVNHGLVSAASGIVSAKMLKAPSLKMTLDAAGAHLKWDPVSGILDYNIFRIDESGNMELICEYKAADDKHKCKYNDSYLPQNGVRYTYGIRALQKDMPGVCESSMTKKYSYYLLAPDEMSVQYAGDTTLQAGLINSRADGQQLQYSVSADFAEYKEIETDNYLIPYALAEELQPDTVYYFKARAFKYMDNGKRVYSGWSEVFSASTKAAGVTEGELFTLTPPQQVIENAISWIDGRISVLKTAEAKVLGAAAWRDDEHFSCSSLITKGYIHAGVDLPTKFYSSSVARHYTAHGFVEVTDRVNTKTGEGLVRGDVLLNTKESHAGMYLGIYNGKPGMMLNATKKHWTTTLKNSGFSWGRVFRYVGEQEAP